MLRAGIPAQPSSVREEITIHQTLYFSATNELRGLATFYGGETGIRTLDTLRYTRFPSVRLQPLGHLSALLNFRKSNTVFCQKENL